MCLENQRRINLYKNNSSLVELDKSESDIALNVLKPNAEMQKVFDAHASLKSKPIIAQIDLFRCDDKKTF